MISSREFIKRNIDHIVYLALGILIRVSMGYMPGWSTLSVMFIGASYFSLRFSVPSSVLLISLIMPLETSQDVIGTFTLYTTEAVLLMLIPGLVRYCIRNEFCRIFPRKTGYPLIIFGAILVLSCTNAVSRIDCFKHIIKWGFIFLAYLIAYNMRSDKIRKVADFAIAGGVIASLIGGYQFISKGFIHLNVTAGLNQHNALAGYLNLAFPFCVYMFDSSKKKWLYFSSGFLVFVALLFTFSRGGWLGWLAGFMVLLLSGFKNIKRFLLYFLPVMFVAIIFFWLKIPPDFRTRVTHFTEFSSSVARLRYYKEGIRMIAEKPILGFGVGNHRHNWREHAVSDYDYIQYGLHNLYLQIAAETGIAGILVFLYMIFLHLKILSKGAISGFSIKTAFLAAFIAFLLHNFVDDLSVMHRTGIMMGMILGAGVKLNEHNKTDNT